MAKRIGVGICGLGKSTPEYVKQVMVNGKRYSDGVHIYCHQDKKNAPEKFRVIKQLFRIWSSDIESNSTKFRDPKEGELKRNVP